MKPAGLLAKEVLGIFRQMVTHFRKITSRSWCAFLVLFLFALAALPTLPSSGSAHEPKPIPRIQLSSPAFRYGATIPKIFTGEGQDISPPLQWSGAPRSTQQFVLIVEDPDVSGPDPWVHWVMYGIPPDVHQLPEKLPSSSELTQPVQARQGTNSFGKTGYNGPQPPSGSGAHRYYFKLFAINLRELQLPSHPTAQNIRQAIEGHIVGEGGFMGRYQHEAPGVPEGTPGAPSGTPATPGAPTASR